MNDKNTAFSGNANTWQHTQAALVHWLQLVLICQDPRQESKVVGLEIQTKKVLSFSGFVHI